MASAVHVLTTVLPGGRVEFTSPELTEGVQVEVVIKPAATPLTLAQRRAFLALPMTERRRILAQQAEAMAAHYASDFEWRSLGDGDIVEY